MAIKIGLAVTDRRPEKPGIVLVRFKGDPDDSDEQFCWYDGTSFSHGHRDVIGARGDKPSSGRLSDARIDRREIEYWRSYSAKTDWLGLLKAAVSKALER